MASVSKLIVSELNKDFKLNGDNYQVWSTKIMFMLEEHEVLGSLSSVMAKPEEGITPQHMKDLEAYVAWTKKNSTARIILLSAMDGDIAKQFHTYENAMDMWISLKHKFGGVSLTKLRTLALKFDTYKMHCDRTMKTHLREMANMMSELSDLGQKMTEEHKVQAVIRSLPNSWTFDHMKMHLIRTESISTFEDAARYLEVEEDRLMWIKTNVEAHFSGASVENSSNKLRCFSDCDKGPKKPKQEQEQDHDKERMQESKNPKQNQEQGCDKQKVQEPEKPKQKQERDYYKEKAQEPKKAKEEQKQDYDKEQVQEAKKQRQQLELGQGDWVPSKKKQKLPPSRRRCLICWAKGHFAPDCPKL